MLIDIIKREFTFFGSTFFGVDPILFFLITVSLLFFIASITSIWGRVWCGWACPQTVFIQSIFLKIEALIEGNARERRNLENAPLSAQKLLKKFFKWVLFSLISLHIAHTFVGYFIGPRELFFITMHSPLEHFGIFTATMIISFIFLLDFGWFREQFCIIACPYGRMQSVIMDENSLIVAYDKKRGEPRRNISGTSKEDEGDCINCYNCVKVCPTGIDIRRGTQLECIACTNCIDACDEIMEKVKRPKGLIRYTSENELNGISKKKVNARSIIYALISISFITMFALFLNKSTNLQLIFLRGQENYTVSANEVTNRFTLKFTHQGKRHYKLFIKTKDPEINNQIKIITPVYPIDINQPEKKVIIFFKFEKNFLHDGVRKIELTVTDQLSQETVATKEVVLVGPNN